MVRFAAILSALFMLGTVANAQDNATYQVDVALDWNTAGGPDNPHWSRLYAVALSSKHILFRDGDTASTGLGLVATHGRGRILRAEMAEANRRGRAGEFLVVPGLEGGSGTISFEIALAEGRSHIAFATMLAPSPDWFTGVGSVNMRDSSDRWIDTLRLPLWVWDAGVDSGPDFGSGDAPLQPRQSVRLLTHPAFLTEEGMRPIGYATITRVDS